MSVIDMEDVSFGYTDVPVVENVTLAIEAGEFLGLVGPNGSGKTTLLALMLGLRHPDEGNVQLFGEPATDCSAGERIGYVAQDATDVKVDMPITVREVVAMGRYPRAGFGTLSDSDRAIIDDALERTGITDLAGRRLVQLSGGQRQRIFIARALAAEANLLALDEPTVGVDTDSREQCYELLHELNEQGITIVLIEHDISVVTEHATQIVCVNREVYFHGDPAGFIESDALAQAYGANQRLLQHGHTQS
jgi:zinc transport system ATP-binding protein